MRILILNWRDPKHPLAGGAEQSLFEHAKYWQKKRADITWVGASFKKAKKSEEIDGIKYIRIGSQFTVHLLFAINFILGRYKMFDLVIDCFHFVPFFTPLYIKKIRKIALINEVAGRLWFANLPYPFAWIGYRLEPLFFKSYGNIEFITASNSTVKDLKNLSVRSKNINIVPHGVTLPSLLPAVKKEKSPTVIYCSRIAKDKGIEDAVMAIVSLKDKVNDLKFWIIGKEEREGYLNDILKRYNLTGAKYYGFVSEAKKFELLSQAWIMVHPSKKEGWGLNVIEANSVGTPAVGYNVEGLRDSIVDGKTGVIVDSKPELLAKILQNLIKDSKYLSKLSKNAVEYSKQFSWVKSGRMSWEVIKY